MTISYPYSQGERLEERNTYFYSSYHGIDFFAAWQASRQSIAAHLPPPLPLAAQSASACPDGQSGWDSSALLAYLLACEPDARARQLAEQLLQRFEVSKRIHARYTTAFRAEAGSDYHDLQRYLAFAALCIRQRRTASALPFLNGLLKCVDSLLSVHARLDEAQQARLHWLIIEEAAWVGQLAARQGLELAA